MDEVQTTDIDERIFEAAPPTGRRFRVWVVTLVISILAHVLLGWLWSLHEPKPLPKTASAELRLKITQVKSSPKSREPDTDMVTSSGTSEAPPNTEQRSDNDPAPDNKSPSNTAQIRKTQAEKARTAESAQPAHQKTEKPSISTSYSGPPSTDNVFDPRLRTKLEGSGKVSTRIPSTTSYTDISGSTRLELGEGKCMRSKVENQRGFTTNWYLTGCKQQQSEGDSIIQGLERRLKR